MLGWPVLVHHCNFCRFDTPVEYSATVWSKEHTCACCEKSSAGADIAGRTAGTMNYSQHDELANLFAQQMTFDSTLPRQTNVDAKQDDQQPTAFISTHYIHPTHIAGVATSSTAGSDLSHSPPPPYNESLMSEAMAEILIRHSIDPNALLPNQISLFTNADYEQRLRLLELWRISPPSYSPAEKRITASWSSTSIQQEEILAKARYETAIIARGLETYQYSPATTLPDFDTHDEPMSPIREPGEVAWPPAARMRAASIAASRTNSRPVSQAEPYMSAGYRNSLQLQQQQQHLDPVYDSSLALWQSASISSAQSQEQRLADQYGQAMQIRNNADWQASFIQDRTAATNDMDMTI